MFEKVKSVLAQQFELDPESITMDTNLIDDLGCAVLPLQTHLCRLCVKGCEQRLRRRCGVCTQQFLDDQRVAISFHDGASAADVHQSAAAHGAQIGLKIQQRC